MRLRTRSTHVAVSITLVVALGIAASVVVVSVLRQAILGSSPYADPAGLVVLENRGAYHLGLRKIEMPELSWPDFQDLAAQQQVFSAIGGVTRADRTVWDPGTRKRSVERVYVTAHLFQALAPTPRVGRLLNDTDFQTGAPAVALMTASLWRAQLGSDSRAVGRVVHVDGQPFTIAGVVDDDVMSSLRPRTTLFDSRHDNQALVLPIVPGSGGPMERLRALRRQNRSLPMLTVVARLKPGRSVPEAEQEVHTIARRLAGEYPSTNGGRTTEALSLTEWRTRAVAYLEPVLLAVAALAWLAACASAAGLVLADAIRREPEMAVRHALGASRRRLVRLILWRSIRWTVPGGFLGMALAWAAVMWVAPGPGAGPIPIHLFEPSVLAQAAGLTALAGLAFGGIASWLLFRQDLALGVKEAAHSALPGPRRRFLLQAVITFQMAAATALGLVCALLIRSMVNIVGVDLGFDPGQTFIVRVFLPDQGFHTAADQSTFLDRALTQVRSLPGVASAAISNTPPLSGVVVTTGGSYRLEEPGHPSKALGPLITQCTPPGTLSRLGCA